jgi:hypothetical protein
MPSPHAYIKDFATLRRGQYIQVDCWSPLGNALGKPVRQVYLQITRTSGYKITGIDLETLGEMQLETSRFNSYLRWGFLSYINLKRIPPKQALTVIAQMRSKHNAKARATKKQAEAYRSGVRKIVASRAA